MKTLALALALAAAATPAAAQWGGYAFGYPTPWGWQCGSCAYGPARIPPGFRAPPLPDPYADARAAQYGLLPPPRPPGRWDFGYPPPGPLVAPPAEFPIK